MAKRVATWFNKQYNEELTLETFRYIFPNQLKLNKVYIPDETHDIMIYAEELNFYFTSFNNITNILASGRIEVNKPQLNWHKYKGSEEYNFKRFLKKISSADTKNSRPRFGLKVDNIKMSEGVFHYQDFNCESCDAYFLKGLQLDLDELYFQGDHFKVNINSLVFHDLYSLKVKQLKGELACQKDHLSIRDLWLETEKTFIRGDFKMEYQTGKAFSNFLQEVTLVAEIDESSISAEDIQVFASRCPNFGSIRLKGRFVGPVNHLNIEGLKLKIGTNTELEGAFLLQNPAEQDSMFMNSEDLSFSTVAEDVQWFYSLFTDSTLPEIVNTIGEINFKGNFKGHLNKFNANGEIHTQAGNLLVDWSVDNLKNPQNVLYKGYLELQKVDLGSLINNASLGVISGSFKVDGMGFYLQSMNSELEARISLLQFNEYDYSAINIDSYVKEALFKGNLSINDPNLKLDFKGQAGFGGDTSAYDFVALIKSANLHALNLSDDTISRISSKLDIHSKTINYDEWAGTIKATASTYENSRNYYFFEDILLTYDGMDSNHIITVASNIVDGKLEGNYTLTGLANTFKYHATKYVKFSKPVKPFLKQRFSFDFTVKNTLVLSEIFIPQLDIEPGSKISGKYDTESQSLVMDISSKGILYDKYFIRNIDLSYRGKQQKSQLAFNIEELQLPGGFKIDSISLENFYHRDTLFYILGWTLRDSIDSKAHLNGFAIQEDDSSLLLSVDESRFNIGQENFIVTKGNVLRVDTGGIHIENLLITNPNQASEVAISGNISDNPNEILRLNITGFGIDLINYFVTTPGVSFDGELYGDVILSQLIASPRFAVDLKVDSMIMNDTHLGDLWITSGWDSKNDSIKIAVDMSLGNLKTMSISGFYHPDSLGSIRFDANFNHFRLTALNPLLTGIAENLRGFLTGDVYVTGSTHNPKVTGILTLPKVAFTVSFLQTDYNLTDSSYVEISENEIKFPKLKLRDSQYGTEGILSGRITHNNFKNVNFDLKVEADELLALSTNSSTVNAYYGTAFVSGTVKIEGLPRELRISSVISTEKKTQFNIPIGGAREVEKSQFVNFLRPDAQDTLQLAHTNKLNVDKGISLNFNIDVNQNSKVNIILDERTGNRLSAKGDGNIKLNIDPYSNMELFGTYTVAEGEYLFNLEGLFNKKFKVLRGGTVKWTGDPLNANLNLQALYTTKTDPGVIVPEYTGSNTLVEVYLNLKGPLSDPEISFHIKTPRLSPNVESTISNRLADQQDINHQVFSLLARNSFAPEHDFFSTADLGVNEWDLLANQAEAWINQLTGDYNVTLNYQGSSAKTNPSELTTSQKEEVEVGVSKRFFNNRVTINGSVDVPLGENKNGLAGYFEVEYNITEDGRFRTTVFNQTVQDQYSLSRQNQQGIGMFYRLGFNSWNDFFPRLLKIKKDRKEKELKK